MAHSSAARGAELKLTGLVKRWPGGTALDGVDVTVAAGRFAVLLGPSGCGKTTCLRIAAGLEQPDSGRVYIGGRDVTALPPAARGVAMVFQSYALFPHLSVAENIVFGLRARRVPPPERARRLAEAASMLGLDKLLDRRPGQLSGGQQQRVALGRAVVAQAGVCFMDEPLSNLDAQLRADMRREILLLQRRLGITMLYVTHDQTEAMGMADQVVLLRAGRVEQDAPPADLYAKPATKFAAGFIGTPPMNLLPADALGTAPAGAQTVGIRPEAVQLERDGRPAQVEHAEYLGADTNLTLSLGSNATLIARIPGRITLQPGAQVTIGCAPDDLHFFDPAGFRLHTEKVFA
jgi:sn-glycerol 3-phosphate transport system ATP-binding protein